MGNLLLHYEKLDLGSVKVKVGIKGGTRKHAVSGDWVGKKSF
jgi:hypothetical protein